jgi:hypothetical protein
MVDRIALSGTIAAGKTIPRITVYAGPINYIHDLTNILPGFVFATETYESITLVARGAFFGPPKRYAEQSCSVSTGGFAHYHLDERSRSEPMVLARPVSFYLPPKVLAAVCSPGMTEDAGPPTVVLAVRGQNRLCINERELLSGIIRKISEKVRCKFIVVGWLWPAQSSREYRQAFEKAAADVGRKVAQIVDDSSRVAYVRGISGWEITDAIPLLLQSKFYAVPCGTINHLACWISAVPGVTFGPKKALSQAREWNSRSVGSVLPLELPDEFLHYEQAGDLRSSFSVDLRAVQFISEVAESTILPQRDCCSKAPC